ncbi:MAG: ATP-binding protein [Croceibacterium sp.]
MLAAAGLVLLAIVMLAVWTNGLFAQRRADVERQALQSAREMVALADAEAEANSKMLQLMASSQAAVDVDMTRMTPFFDLSLGNNPSWNGLVLRDRTNGRILLEKGRRSMAQPLRTLPGELPGGLGIEGVFADGRYCPCVVFHKQVIGAPQRELTLFMSPNEFSRIVRNEVAGSLLGAVLDQNGRFLARSVDSHRRVGTQARPYALAAVARSEAGTYRGVTFEGTPTYTAFAKSRLTGWSGHVAVDRTRVDGPRSLANASVAIAVLAALILAAGLSFYAAGETRNRRRQEARLVAMQKAEAISRFTSTAVHDFRNILAVIEAGVGLIVRKTDDPYTLERARAIGEAVERGNRLTNQLLSFVRGDGAEVTRLDLRSCLEGCDEIIKRSLGDGIEYNWGVVDGARHALGNADQLELALLNLAINARDAMDGQGKFSIDVTREGDLVAINACDTGPGVPKALRERIFEAFYSTKRDGEGTGLGLVQVAGAARQAGGHVELRDRADGGACFVIYLPRVE